MHLDMARRMSPFASVSDHSLTFKKGMGIFPCDSNRLAVMAVACKLHVGYRLDAYRFYKLSHASPTVRSVGNGMDAFIVFTMYWCTQSDMCKCSQHGREMEKPFALVKIIFTCK